MGRIMVQEKFKQLLHNMGDYFPFKTSSQVWWAKPKNLYPYMCLEIGGGYASSSFSLD